MQELPTLMTKGLTLARSGAKKRRRRIASMTPRPLLTWRWRRSPSSRSLQVGLYRAHSSAIPFLCRSSQKPVPCVIIGSELHCRMISSPRGKNCTMAEKRA